MMAKIKNSVQKFKKIFIKYYFILGEVKNFFSPMFDVEIKERGAAVTLTALAIAAIVSAVLGALVTFAGNVAIAGAEIAAMYWLATVMGPVIIVGLSNLLLETSYALALFSSNTFSYLLSEFIIDNQNKWVITRSLALLKFWNIAKTWANMLIVLGFIGVAIAFILNLEQYKKKLVPLLIVALLINFSVVFVGLMIDVSNIVMGTFVSGGDIITTLILPINDMWNKTARVMDIGEMHFLSGSVFNFEKLYKAAKYAGVQFIFTLTYFVLAITLFWISLIIIQRYVMLGILFILSPLAFVFYVLPIPKAQELFKKWWEYFIKWCFIGVAVAFFVGLASNILGQFPADFFKNFPLVQDADKIMGKITEPLLRIGVILMVLIVGMKIALKTSGTVAGVVIGAAMSVGKLALVGGAGLAVGAASLARSSARGVVGGAAKMAGNTKYGSAIKDKVTASRDSMSDFYHRGREKIGLTGAGTAETVKQNRMQEKLKEPTERLKNIKDNDKLATLAAKGGAEGAAATNILKERDSLHEIAAPDREASMRNAMAHNNTLSVGDFAKSNHEFRAFDNDRIQNIATQRGVSVARARRIAVHEQLETNIPSYKPEQLRNIDHALLTPKIVDEKFSASMIKQYSIASADHINQLQGPVRTQLSDQFDIANSPTSLTDPTPQNQAEANRLLKLIEAIDRL